MFYDCTLSNTTAEKGVDLFDKSFKGLWTMFYLVSPKSTMFKTQVDVPNFFEQAWPYFFVFIIMEHVMLTIQGRNGIRLNDSLTSISNGIFMESGRLIWRSTESYIYTWIYTHYRIVELPLYSMLTWYAAALSVDLCYYWMHRACHGIHILWAQHQVHHSSEEFNMAVGIRQSILQGWFGLIFYLPLAFVIPPAEFVTHYQLNYLYMFWIHTEAFKSLGPLEYVLNTPSHHRVHHGSNKYCLDVNFGGVLIIWDRIFGTFRPEIDKIQIAYGIINNQPSFNPLFLQTFYTAVVFDKFNKLSLWGDKVKAFVLRPSWEPGKPPRRFTEEDLKEVKYQEKYDVSLPTWCSVYITMHYAVTLFVFFELMSSFVEMTPITVLVYIFNLITSLTIMGMIFDNSKHAPILEALRCAALALLTTSMNTNITIINTLRLVYMSSASFWGIYILKLCQNHEKNR